MKLKKAWKILGIDETTKESVITQAYREKLTLVNPEDDAVGFMKLREAYELAIRSISKPIEEQEELEKNEVDLWIDKVNKLYESVERRIKKENWEELFKDEICIGVDTSIEAREKILVYLMDHFYFPHEVWKAIEAEFNIIDSKEQLYEQFPKDFIDYVINQITYRGFFEFELLKNTEDTNDADEYIKNYFDLRTSIYEKKLEESLELLEELRSYEIYHPYEDVELTNYYLLTDKFSEAVELADKLINDYPEDVYVILNYANVKNKEGKYDEAEEYFQKILNQFPDYYLAGLGIIEVFYKKAEYSKAKEVVLDMLEEYGNDDVLYEKLKKTNNKLIEEYEKFLKDNDDSEIKLELAWCLYQNNSNEESIAILKELPEEIKSKYNFINLEGRVYASAGLYGQAINKLKLWVEKILATKKDDSKESKKRYARLSDAYFSVGQCYYHEGLYDEAIEYLNKSFEVEKRAIKRHGIMEGLARSYMKKKEYDTCIDICDGIIEENNQYYPAYLFRQEANYKIGRYQAVINDYYTAIDIYPGFIRPYLFAIKSFFIYNQSEDVKKVIDRVEEAGLESNEFELLNIKFIRKYSEEELELVNAIERCKGLIIKLDSEDNDIESPDSVYYEMIYLHKELKQYGKALDLINEIISETINKEAEVYDHMLEKGEILRKLERYSNAVNIYKALIEKNPEDSRAYYEIASSYYKLNDLDKALENFLKTRELDPEHYNVNDNIVDIYRDKLNELEDIDYYKKALPYADKQLELYEHDYYYNSRGLLHSDAYEFEKALSDYYKALELNDNNMAALNNAGHANLLMKDMDKAIKDLEKATSKVSIEKFRLPYANLAKAYHIVKNYEEAIKYYKMLNKHYPDMSMYIDRLICVYQDCKDIKNSIKWIKILGKIKDVPSSQINNKFAQVYFLNGNLIRTRIHYMLAAYKGDMYKSMNLAKFLLYTKRYSSAIRVTNSALKKVKPDDVECIEYYRKAAEIYWSMQIFRENLSEHKKKKYNKKANKLAKKAIESIIRIKGSEEKYYEYPGCRTSKLVDLVSIYLSMGEEEKAFEYLEMGLNSYPCRWCRYEKCVELYELYGMLYEFRGQLDKAIECYELIIREDPGEMFYMKSLDNAKRKYKG